MDLLENSGSMLDELLRVTKDHSENHGFTAKSLTHIFEIKLFMDSYIRLIDKNNWPWYTWFLAMHMEHLGTVFRLCERLLELYDQQWCSVNGVIISEIHKNYTYN